MVDIPSSNVRFMEIADIEIVRALQRSGLLENVDASGYSEALGEALYGIMSDKTPEAAFRLLPILHQILQGKENYYKQTRRYILIYVLGTFASMGMDNLRKYYEDNRVGFSLFCKELFLLDDDDRQEVLDNDDTSAFQHLVIGLVGGVDMGVEIMEA